MKRILVCGGRDYEDRARVHAELDALTVTHGHFVVVQGGADGADALAYEWAIASRLPVWTFPANWGAHGRRAGPVRNQLMLDVAKPHLVVAFPGGRGTQDMVTRALHASIEVMDLRDGG